MKEVIEQLNEGLKDPGYRQGWVSNIAMAHIDSERWYRERTGKIGSYLNKEDKNIIANEAAEYFLILLEG